MTTFERSRQRVRLHVLGSSPSTNAALASAARDATQSPTRLQDFETYVTEDQTAGRGRLDRAWITPAGSALAISVLVDATGLTAAGITWMPLLAGLAMAEAVASVLPGDERRVGIKWPNDVLVDGRKVSGILCELVEQEGVVVGAGINLRMTPEELPVATATSLAIAGAADDDLPDRVLDAYLAALRSAVGRLRSAGGAEESGLRADVIARCSTIGREVRAELPGGTVLHGTAVGIDRDGRLEVRDDSGDLRPVAAGDIIHLR